MSLFNNISSAALRQAAVIKEKIEALQNELVKALNSTTVSLSVTSTPTGAKKNGLSVAAKQKIVAAQKARWAKFHASQKPFPTKPAQRAKVEPVKPARKKGGLSAEGRAKIGAAAKARWAKINAAKTATTK
jgi:hypothetical protein